MKRLRLALAVTAPVIALLGYAYFEKSARDNVKNIDLNADFVEIQKVNKAPDDEDIVSSLIHSQPYTGEDLPSRFADLVETNIHMLRNVRSIPTTLVRGDQLIGVVLVCEEGNAFSHKIVSNANTLKGLGDSGRLIWDSVNAPRLDIREATALPGICNAVFKKEHTVEVNGITFMAKDFSTLKSLDHYYFRPSSTDSYFSEVHDGDVTWVSQCAESGALRLKKVVEDRFVGDYSNDKAPIDQDWHAPSDFAVYDKYKSACSRLFAL